MRLWPGALALTLLGCDRHAATHGSSPIASSAPAPVVAESIHCENDPRFPSPLDVPEASAAAEVELRPGVREILVVADSGRGGAALAYALPDGPARRLTLPLDPSVTDDIEGLAWRSGHLYALASTGFVERFSPDGHGGLVRDGASYALGAPPFSSEPTNAKGRPPDFEGLCLRPEPTTARCAGYAASRAYGWLICLVLDGDRLRVSPVRPRLALDVKKGSLSDCAFGAADGPARDDLLVTTNVHGGSTVYRVEEASGELAPIAVESTLNNEAIVVDHDGRLYQMADTDSEQSAALRATCAGW